jgi:nucleotide sugar dehydrogenase
VQIAVIALGKIGLPLAVQFAGMGHPTVGVDTDPDVVALVGKGVAPFPGEQDLAERLLEVVDAGRLTATTDTVAAVRESDAVVVVVPLFVDDDAQPDFRALDAATAAIAEGLHPGLLVSYETTLPVGTTRERFLPILERGGLRCGTDFWLVFSPERVLSGRVFADLRKYPKLVGGIDQASAERGAEFYRAVLEFDERPDLDRPNGVWDMGGAEAAELAKLAETTYRDVNIGLANQFALFASRAGIDVHRVIEASNSQPYSHIHRPGIAVGGHCIPVYPQLYLWRDPDATLVRAAREINIEMPERTVALLDTVLGSIEGRRVAVLGAAYRGGVQETAFSGVFGAVAALQARGAEVMVHDPLYDDDELRALGFTAYHLGEPVDVAVVQTDHAAYGEIGADDLPGLLVLVDGRRVTSPEGWGTATRVVLGEPLP